MIKSILSALLITVIIGCKSPQPVSDLNLENSDFVIAFGSCNRHDLDNRLWDDVRKQEPDIWIWGGDNIYADTADMEVMAAMYDAQNKVKGYRKLRAEMPVLGVWDDHDYGLNDGGAEWIAKDESQQVFLDFMGIDEDSPRRYQKGIYTAHNYQLSRGRVKLLMLDTRYFRSPLTPDSSGVKRYVHNAYGEGELLGEQQWQWLANELHRSDADFNVIVSSIQFLSDEHGFETWGNFPHEVDRMKELIVNSQAKGVIFLTGDRHISEFSKSDVDGLSYPLLDFTSSGLTHAYREYSGEPNRYRLGGVVATESFGTVRINFVTKTVRFEMIGDGGEVLSRMDHGY